MVVAIAISNRVNLAYADFYLKPINLPIVFKLATVQLPDISDKSETKLEHY